MYQKDIPRNWDKIQFERLRKEVDSKFNDVHDELSDCYYNKKSFRAYGILTKEKFDKLHGLIFLLRDVKFHQDNSKQPVKDRISEEKYNEIKDENGNVIGKKIDKTIQEITKLKNEGLKLTI